MISPKSPQWLWLFPAAFFVHIFEEIKDVGSGSYINLSLTKFFSLAFLSLGLLILGIFLADKYGFPQLLSVGLATAFFLNAASHLLTSLRASRYSAGVVTGVLLFMPIAIWTLVVLVNSMSHARFSIGLAIGLATQGVASFLRL